MNKYDCVMYDCDGVILDSNLIKSDAFYNVALPYGKNVAKEFVEYHKQTGGVSRFKKMEYLLKDLVNDYSIEKYDKALEDFANYVKENLLKTNYVLGFEEFINKSSHSTDNYVVSGGREEELIDVFKQRDISKYFKKINGSPRTKYEIVDSLLSEKEYKKILFIGDSKLDYEVAANYGMDFLFVSGVSEFKNWEDFFKDKEVEICKNFKEIL